MLIHFNDGSDVYFAGDTALTYDMRLIGEVGGVDLAALPIGDNFTMGPDDAIQAAQFVKAKKVIPIHYNTFPPIEQDAEAFAQKLLDETDIECAILNPGDTLGRIGTGRLLKRESSWLTPRQWSLRQCEVSWTSKGSDVWLM